jgi:hypothetical protein
MSFAPNHRNCSRPLCSSDADAVLLFDYGRRHVVLDELSAVADPNVLELCDRHAESFRPPHGWSLDDRRSAIDLTPSERGPAELNTPGVSV